MGTVVGTPYGILAIITIGELNGIILDQTASDPPGSCMAMDMIRKEKMIGMVMGNKSDWASCGSSFTTEPTAANREA